MGTTSRSGLTSLGPSVHPHVRGDYEVGEARFLALLEERLGGLPALLVDPTGLPVLVDRGLVGHLKGDGRERFLAWLPDLVRTPQEVWLAPLQHERRVVFRQRYFKVYRVDGGALALVLEVHRGVPVGLTIAQDPRDQRMGFLRWAR